MLWGVSFQETTKYDFIDFDQIILSVNNLFLFGNNLLKWMWSIMNVNLVHIEIMINFEYSKNILVYT